MPSLLSVTIALWIVGFLLILVGNRLKPPKKRLDKPSLGQVLAEILDEMLKAFRKISKGPTLGHRLEGAGSLCILLGIGTFAVWAASELLGGQAPKTPTGSPQPNTSPSV